MNKWVMEIQGTALEIWDKPQYLKSFDVESHGGRGDAVITSDIKEALRFDSFMDVMEAWRSESKIKPVRPDGKPNRPLTVFTVSPKQVEDR